MKRGTRTFSIAFCGPVFLLCLAAAAQTTNVSWTRQAYGQEWQDGCDEMQETNEVFVPDVITWPDNNNWSQSEVEGTNVCGAGVIVQPSNWSITNYPNGTNYNVTLNGPAVFLDTNVSLNMLTIQSAGELDVPASSTLTVNTLNFQGTISGVFTNRATTLINGTNASSLTGAGTLFDNQNEVQQSGVSGLVVGGGATFVNESNGSYLITNNSSIATSGRANSAALFENYGLVWKSGGTNRAILAAGLSNQGGTVRVDSGALDLSGGGYTQEGGGFVTQITGINVGQFGQLACGSVALGGALTVTLGKGFAPATGQEFEIISCSNVSGAFSSVSVPAGCAVIVSNIGVYVNFPGATRAQLIGAGQQGSNIVFSLQTVNQQSYTVQQNSDLTTTNWVYCTNLTGNGALSQVIVPMTGGAGLYFRVREP
jgi:hypothetical protein